MQLLFGDLKATVQIIESDEKESLHTGKILNLIKVETIARGEQTNKQFLELLKQAKDEKISSINGAGDLEKYWKVANTSWQFRDGEEIYYHTIELEEVEDLIVDSLDIDGFAVKPYWYNEEFHFDGLRIEAKVSLSEEQHQKLKSMMSAGGTFSVTRVGISEKPITMNFGISYWSKSEDLYKYEILLFDENKGKRLTTGVPALQWSNAVRSYVAKNSASIDFLLHLLQEKNIISPEEREKINAETESRSQDIYHELFRVDDIDKY